MPTAIDGDVLTYDATLEQFIPKTPGAGVPGSGTVTSVALSGGTTGLTVSGSPITSSGTIELAGVVTAAHGGTGQSSYTTGDLLYASNGSALSKLPDVATGNVLISGGVGAAPSYGKVGLATHVSGTLPVANGGTGATSFTAGSIPFSDGSALVQDNTNLFYDDSLNRLRVGELFVSAATANLFIKDTSTGFQVASSTVITPQANNAIRSTNYTSGLVGWNISALGDAEFNNVDVRGAIHSAVFVYNALFATAGTLGIFKSAAKLISNVTVPASPTYGTTTVSIDVEDQEGITHAASQLFVVNDILYLKDGLTGYTYFRVSAVSDQTTFWRYTATIMAGSNNVTYRAGLGVADYGQSGQGFIIQTADRTNAPYIQMATHSATFTSQDAVGELNVTPQLRIGNLNGSYGYASNVYGFGAGAYGVPGTAWVTVDQTSGIRLGSNTTTRIQLATDGSGFLASSQIAWDTSGNITFSGALSGASGTFSGSLTAASGSITGTLAISSATGALAIGVTPPVGPSSGTGIWIDRDGMHFLNSSIQRLKIDAVGQITVLDWGVIFLEQKPIKFQNAAAQNLGQITGSEVGGGVGGKIQIDASGTVSNAGSDLLLQATNYAATQTASIKLATTASARYITLTGFVGLGTVNPSVLPLHVGPGADAPGFGSAATTAFYGTFNGQTDYFLRDSTSDIVGRFTVGPATYDVQIGSATNHRFDLLSNNTVRASIYPVGNIVLGVGSIATTATDGDVYIPSCAGTPTGTPTAYTGMVPLRYDRTNNILYAFSNGAWRAH